MLKNYLKTALRNLSRNKVYGILNVLGLALGIGCALVIYKVIAFESSFDKHQANYSKIYRIVHQNIRAGEVTKGMGTPHPVGPALKEDFPDLQEVVRIHYSYGDQINVKDGNELQKFLLDEGVAYTENAFFRVFTVNFLAGDSETALKEPNTAVISASQSRKFFGLGKGEEHKALGRNINVGNQEDYTIVGVIADPPKTTNFPFTVLLEYNAQAATNPYFGEGKRWNSTSSNTNTYVLAGKEFNRVDFDQKLIPFVEKYMEEGASERKRFLVQPLADIHYDNEYGNYVYATSPQLIKALTIIAIFLILTACINFINLATAQAANRSKEIGIRKAIGGHTTQLIFQFFAEVTLITLMAIFCSLAIAEFLFVQLEDVIGVRLSLELFDGGQTLVFLFLLLVVVSFLSGFYPSFLLSRLNTVRALKNKINTKEAAGGLSLRKALVVAQFAISQFLIIGTVIISAQMKYFTEKDLGFEKEAIIKSYLPEQDEVKRERFRQLMLSSPAIEEVSFSLSSPTGNSNAHSDFNYPPLNEAEDFEASYKPADESYLKLYGLKLLAGRNLQKNDSTNHVLINQQIANLMGFQDNYEAAIGERLTSGWRGQQLKIIGVVRDFHSRDLSEDFQYVIILRDPEVFYELAFKTKEGVNVKQAITHFEDSWEQVFPEYVVDWQFFDEELAENYEQEQSIATLMHTFSVVSIVIGCLGLYGLIAFISANRTKEVGIRKVLGASVLSIVARFTREVFVLIILAFFIAAPAAYFIMNRWLSDYKFRIDIGLGFFLVAFLVTLFIAAITVGHRTIVTAMINPATTLKDE